MGHWYDTTGAPRYEVPYADPKRGLRPTTLGDAKKQGLAKSVTTVLDIPDKPALLRWKIDQIKAAVFNNLELVNWDDLDGWWAKSVIKESESIGKNSATRGAELHDALEKFYLGGDLQIKDLHFISPVVELINKEFPGVEWVPEQSFTSNVYGYGGRVDMYSPSGIVLDFKTKATADIKKMIPYDGHHMQTAAYTVGLSENDRFETNGCCSGLPWGSVRRYNLFISTEQPGLLNLTESTNFERDWAMFKALNTYWDLSNNFKLGDYRD